MATENRGETEAPPRISLLPAVFFLVFALALCAGGFFLLRKKGAPGAAAKSVPQEASGNLPTLTRAEAEFTEGAALAVAQAFANETDATKRLKLVRDPSSVESRLANFPAQALTAVPVSVDGGAPGSVGGALCLSFKAAFADGSARLLAVLRTDDGPRVDWDCYARHCSAPWPEILSGTVPEAEVRAFAAPGGYYNFDFPDDTAWKCFVLRSPDLDQPLRAYARIGSEVEKALSNSPDGDRRATLRIRISPAQAARRQCEIQELVTLGWVKP